MASIIKTWPAAMEPRRVLTIFSTENSAAFMVFYFTISRGKPKQEIEKLWFTYRGRVLGYFIVDEVVCNTGDNIPKLRRIDGGDSEWQIKLYNWVAVCSPPFHRLRDKVFYDSFRGFHYFSLDDYLRTPESRIAL